MAELLKIEGFATKEIALSQKPINEVLKESEGVLISFTKANVKKNLTALVKKHSKEINELIAKDQLSTKEENRLKELRAIHKEPRIALDKITKHNSSVLAQASKSSKVVKDELTLIVEPVEDKITARLESEEKRREKARQEKEDQENERKAKLQKIVDVVAADLKSIIESTKEFSDIEENEKQFNSILAVFDNSNIDLQDYRLVYDDMVLEQSEAFDSLIKTLTTEYDLEQKNNALKVANLTNSRMSELFDYDYKYKGEKALGELSIEEYLVEHLKAKKSFRIKEIEAIGLVGNESLQSWIYASDTDIIVLQIKLETIENTSDDVWNMAVETAKNDIYEWNNPKEELNREFETETIKHEENSVEVVESGNRVVSNLWQEKEKEVNEIEVIETYSDFEAEAKENLENTISLEPNEFEVEIPKPKENVDLSLLKEMVIDYIKELAKPQDKRRLKDINHYIYEQAIETFYNKDIWDFINERID